MSLEVVSDRDVGWLGDLYVRCHRSTRRQLELLGSEVVETALRSELESASRYPVALTSRFESSTAYAAMSRDQWTSERVELGVARIGPVFADGESRHRVRPAAEVLSGCVRAASDAGTSLIVVRLAVDDHEILKAAVGEGFEHVGDENVYFRERRPKRNRRESHEVAVEVETILGGSPIDIEEFDRARLIDRSAQFRLSHLGETSMLPAKAAAQVYREWTENVVGGQYGDVVAVARIEGRVVGFFAWMQDRELAESHGVDLLNRSWVVVSEERRGVLQALGESTIELQADGVGWIECETQVQNLPMNIVLDRIGSGPPPQRCSVLHRWIRR